MFEEHWKHRFSQPEQVFRDNTVPLGKATDTSDSQLDSILRESCDLCEGIFLSSSDWIKIPLVSQLAIQLH